MCFLCTLEEAAQQSLEPPDSKHALATLEASQVTGEGEMAQVFKCEEVDGETAGENEKEGTEARDDGPAGQASPPSEAAQPFQPEHDAQRQPEQLHMEPEPAVEEKADERMQNEDCLTASVAGVECMTTLEELPVESTDGGGEVVDVVEEKPQSVEGSEGGQQSPDEEEGSNREGEDVSDVGRGGGQRSGSEGDHVLQTDRRSSLG